LGQLRAQIELRGVAGATALFSLGWRAVVKFQALQLLRDLGVAFGELRADEVERTQRVLERNEVFGSPVALHAAHVERQGSQSPRCSVFANALPPAFPRTGV
jgi:hypothetical protein